MRYLSYQERHDRIDEEMPAVALVISCIFGIPVIVGMLYIMRDRGFSWWGFGVVATIAVIILTCLAGTIGLVVSRCKEKENSNESR